jgi:hypothetical protein
MCRATHGVAEHAPRRAVTSEVTACTPREEPRQHNFSGLVHGGPSWGVHTMISDVTVCTPQEGSWCAHPGRNVAEARMSQTSLTRRPVLGCARCDLGSTALRGRQPRGLHGAFWGTLRGTICAPLFLNLVPDPIHPQAPLSVAPGITESRPYPHTITCIGQCRFNRPTLLRTDGAQSMPSSCSILQSPSMKLTKCSRFPKACAQERE